MFSIFQQAGEIVLTQPEVRQVTLPATGGRIIIASDGLWDSVTPKTAAHHVRGLPASKAARELGQVSLVSASKPALSSLGLGIVIYAIIEGPLDFQG